VRQCRAFHGHRGWEFRRSFATGYILIGHPGTKRLKLERDSRKDMMREVLSAVMAMLLVANFNYAAAPQIDSKAAKTRVIAIPMGSLVDVRLNDKEKIRGRMGEVSEEGFVLQAVQGGKVETRKIAFTDIKSVKSIGKSHTTRNILLVACIGVGVIVVLLTLRAGLNPGIFGRRP
jgi:hypothetical protein